jgi:hypothetical protein
MGLIDVVMFVKLVEAIIVSAKIGAGFGLARITGRAIVAH